MRPNRVAEVSSLQPPHHPLNTLIFAMTASKLKLIRQQRNRCLIVRDQIFNAKLLIIYFVQLQQGEVMLVTMFAKGDMENIPVAKLKEIRRALEI